MAEKGKRVGDRHCWAQVGFRQNSWQLLDRWPLSGKGHVPYMALKLHFIGQRATSLTRSNSNDKKC